MSRINCKYLDEGNCLIVYQIADNTVFEPTPENCQTCAGCSPPQYINDYTRAVSDKILKSQGKPGLFVGIGPGTLLKKTISWFIDQPKDCDCALRSAIMDAWGVQGCVRNSNTIIHWLAESAAMNGIEIKRRHIAALVYVILSIPTFQHTQEKG